MDNLENNVQSENTFVSTNEINEYLLETIRWGKFLAIIGYIGMGILIILALAMFFGLSKIGQLPNSSFPFKLVGLLYLVFAAIYYFPVNYLYKFSVEMKQGLIANDLSSVTSGFRNLKSLFRFTGIFTIVILSLYALILAIAIPTLLFALK